MFAHALFVIVVIRWEQLHNITYRIYCTFHYLRGHW